MYLKVVLNIIIYKKKVIIVKESQVIKTIKICVKKLERENEKYYLLKKKTR